MARSARMMCEKVRLWGEANDFLIEEANRLDHRDVDGWLQLLTDDVRYRMPVRTTRYSGGPSEISVRSMVLDEDLFTLRARAARLHTRTAWAEDPPPRTRHMVSNVALDGVAGDEWSVRSSVMLWRFRLDDTPGELLTAERHDRLRRTNSGLRLASRLVLTDQAVLTMSSLTTFL